MSGDEIPDVSLQHEPKRVDQAPHRTTAPRPGVLGSDSAPGPHRTSHRGQHGRVIGFSKPAFVVDEEAVVCRVYRCYLRGRRAEHLEPRRRKVVEQTEVTRACLTDNERLEFGGRHAGDRGSPAIDQSHPAARAGAGPHRYSHGVEGCDVSLNRPGGDAVPHGQVRHRRTSTRQVHHHCQQPRGAHHRTVRRNDDIGCRELLRGSPHPNV